MQVLLLRRDPLGGPLVGVVVAAVLVLLEYVGPLAVQRLSQVLQQRLQGLVRGILQQGDAKALVDDGLRILNAPHPAAPLAGPLKIFSFITHKTVLLAAVPRYFRNSD